MSEEKFEIQLSPEEALTLYRVLGERELHYGTLGTNKGEYISNELANINKRLGRKILTEDVAESLDRNSIYL